MDELIRRFDKLNNFLMQQHQAGNQTRHSMETKFDVVTRRLDSILTSINRIGATFSAFSGGRRGGLNTGITQNVNPTGTIRAMVNLTSSLNVLNTSVLGLTTAMAGQQPAPGQSQQPSNTSSTSTSERLARSAQIGILMKILHELDAYRRAGFTRTQSGGMALKTLTDIPKNIVDAFRTGSFISPLDQRKLQLESATRLMNITPERDESLKTLMGVTQDAGASAQLQLSLERAGRMTPKMVTEFTMMSREFATISRISPGALVKKMAENADLFANAANRSGNSVAAFITTAERLNVSTQSVKNFANSMTSDFENFLEMQSQMQVFMPGVDLTNVAMAAQFGTEQDVLNELMSSFGGTDIGTLPRSIRNMLTRLTGFSESELVSIGQGLNPLDKVSKEAEDADGKNQKVFGDAVADFAQAVTMFVLGTSALTALTGVFKGGAAANLSKWGMAGRFAAKGGGLLAGGLSFYDEWNSHPERSITQKALRSSTRSALSGGGFAAGVMGGAALGQMIIPIPVVGGLIGGVIGGALGAWGGNAGYKKLIEPQFDKAKKFHTGGVITSTKIMPDEVPAILQKGEAVLNRSQLSGLTKLIDSISDLGKIGDTVERKMSNISISSFAKTFENFTDTLFGSNGIVNQLGSVTQGGLLSLGGIGSSILGGLGGTGSNILSTITGGISSLGSTGIGKTITGAISGLADSGIGKTISGAISSITGGGIGKTISGITGSLGGLLGGGSGGIAGAVGGLLGGGGITNALGGLLGGSGIASTVGSLVGGSGISSVLGGLAGGPIGIAASLAAPLLQHVPVVGGLVTGATKALGSVTGAIGSFVGGIFGNSKDKNRLKTNEQMFQRALGGDSEALNYLKHRSGRYGEAQIGGTTIGGWATDKAKNDAYKKYTQALSATGGLPGSAGLQPNTSPEMQAQSQTGMTASTMPVSQMGPATPALASSNADVVAKLDELIGLIRGGALSVNMDGKKVGDQLATTFSRGHR